MASLSDDRGPRCVLEVLGVAGAGKSTILRSLARRVTGVLDGTQVARRRYPIRTLARILKYYGEPWYGASGGLARTWIDAKNLAYLDAFRQVVGDFRPPKCQAIVFDHGPLYRLGQHYQPSSPSIAGVRAARRWNEALQYWSATLDLVIMLDAPDQALIKRVLARPNHHRLKDMTPSDAGQFVAEARRTFLQVLTHVQARGRVCVLTLNTSQHTVDEVVQRVASQCRELSQRKPDQWAAA